MVGCVAAVVFLLLAVVAGWGCIGRMAQSFMLSALGIDWAQVSPGDRLTTFVGGALGVVGLFLTGAATWVALEQRWSAQREEAKKAVLRVVVPNPGASGYEKASHYKVYLLNEGDKAGSGFWYLGVPKSMRERVSVEPAAGNEAVEFPADNWDIFSEFDQPGVSHFTDDYYLLKFMVTRPVEPGVMMPCATVSVEWSWELTDWMGQKSSEYRTQARRMFGWFTNGPAGRVPEKGMLKLRMYARTEGAFKNYHGGIELPPDDPEEFP